MEIQRNFDASFLNELKNLHVANGKINSCENALTIRLKQKILFIIYVLYIYDYCDKTIVSIE